MRFPLICAATSLFASLAVSTPAVAQTVGYAGAIDVMARACGADIAKYCSKEPLGGGRVGQCLDRNNTAISPACRASRDALEMLLHKRAVARLAVRKVCDNDIKRLCAGVQPGDGNLMECFAKVRNSVSDKCRQVVIDAGYDVGLAPAQPTSQVALNPDKLVADLNDEPAQTGLTAASLRQAVLAGMKDPARAGRVNRAPISEQLNNLPQFTIAVQFDFDSARINPESFKAVGLMADALYHPSLLGYRFLVVGHTDAKGGREYNLKLSQARADAIRDALINPFGISPARLEAVGLGEEQLLDRQHPEAAENRRVQLINIGH
jgi:outer membrane protein OmpA-like peptidoglycan-associated protein